MLKIFVIVHEDGEKTWIAAETNIQALKEFLSISSMDIVEMKDEEVINEVPKEEWPVLTIRNPEYDVDDPEDWEIKTFEEFMKDCSGAEIICSTTYD